MAEEKKKDDKKTKTFYDWTTTGIPVKMAPNAPQQFYWRVGGQNGSLLSGRDNLIVVMYYQLIITQIQVISKLYKVTTCIMTVENDGIYLPNVILVRCPKRRKQDTI